jgi:hypothetical protein
MDKFCVDCKHCIEVNEWVLNCALSISLVTGETAIRNCWEERLNIGLCGVDGTMWEAKDG